MRRGPLPSALGGDTHSRAGGYPHQERVVGLAVAIKRDDQPDAMTVKPRHPRVVDVNGPVFQCTIIWYTWPARILPTATPYFGGVIQKPSTLFASDSKLSDTWLDHVSDASVRWMLQCGLQHFF